MFQQCLFAILVMSVSLLTSCTPAEVTNYEPTSEEESFFLTSEWCGYDVAAYPDDDVPISTKIRTLYKMKLNILGKMDLSSVTQAVQYFIKKEYEIFCKFTGPGTMNCNEISIQYRLNGSSILTDLLPAFFPEHTTTQFSVCSKKQLGEF